MKNITTLILAIVFLTACDSSIECIKQTQRLNRISSLVSEHEHLFQEAKNFAHEIKTPTEVDIVNLRTKQEKVRGCAAQVDSLEGAIRRSKCDKFINDRLTIALSGFGRDRSLYDEAMMRQMEIALGKLQGAYYDNEYALSETRSREWEDTMRVLNEQLRASNKKAEKAIRNYSKGKKDYAVD